MKGLAPLAACGWLWILWGAYWYISSKFVTETKETEGLFRRLQHLVPIVIGLALIFYGSSQNFLSGVFHYSVFWKFVGVAITLMGLSFAVWARIHLGCYWSGTITLKEGHHLIQSGPYRLVSHPIYTGFLAGALGSAIASGTIDAVAGLIIIVIAYLVKIKREEVVLLKEFGQEYADFKTSVSALIPYVFRPKNQSTKSVPIR